MHANVSTMAEQADRHELYEQSVQSVETEVEFLAETYRALRDREPGLLREDFCGTGAVACEWVKSDQRHRAVGVDIDAEVLGWGKRRHIPKLSAEQRSRVQLVQDDVLRFRGGPADIIVGFNFSYWIFKTRDLLREYFVAVREGLADDGILFLDAFGGSEAHDECKEKTKHDGFTYIWQQDNFDPISHDMDCYIHFKFPDSSKMKRAFSYHWRLWSLPELRELLAEAGFSKSTLYWETEDEDGEGSGEYQPVERGTPDPAWVAYIVVEK